MEKTMGLVQEWVLESDDTPENVVEEISELWSVVEFGNDNFYFSWGSEEAWWYDQDEENLTYAQRWPAIAAYLQEKNVTICLIHYWW